MLKFVYVLTCDENNYCFEQWLMSAYSLRYRMADAYVVLLTDEKSIGFIQNQYKKEVEKYANEIKIIDLPEGLTQVEASRFIKTSLRKHIDGDFLFLDCDTLVVQYLDEVQNWEFDIACVFDAHRLKKDYIIHQKQFVEDVESKLSFGITDSDDTDDCRRYYFNSGVIFCKDNERTHRFYEEWHKQWLFSKSKGVSFDQPAFYKANCVLNGIISELPGKYNAQILEGGGVRYLFDAKIIHYYYGDIGISPYYPRMIETLRRIRENAQTSMGAIDGEIKTWCEKPEQAFIPDAKIYSMVFDVRTISMRKVCAVILKRAVRKVLFLFGIKHVF